LTHHFIHPKAQIGENVEIGLFSHISQDVIIGDNTWIGPNVTIMDGARIGSNCRIFPGAVISGEPQDLKFEGEFSTAEIGDFTTVRECATINRGTKATGKTVVGSHNLIMSYVHVAHDCIIGNHCVLSNATNLAGHVLVEDHVTFGGMCAVHQFVKIGKHAFVAGGSLVRKDVPPYVIAAKEPMMFTGINSVGLKRRQFALEDLHLIQDLYRYIYSSGFNISQALEKIEEDFSPTPIRNEIIHFIRTSERGVIRGL
jgi:UDP-N-acetylglucosamine acyltransferase